ncbi:MAG: hypothetical protein HRT61_23855, partial [Ekhidna sp.]|nr:hypothetical protein [Ekhidna sp.]
PLTFPDNSSLDENNIVLNAEGDFQRRLGMDYEDNRAFVTSGETNRSDIASSTYRWENAGGSPEKSILVVQFGSELKFFDFNNATLSSQVLHTATLDISVYNNIFSYTVVDGLLVVATGLKTITVFDINPTTDVVTQTSERLKIRDLFGVEDVVDGVDLLDGNNVTTRPTTKTDAHLYNLRNQSWGVPRRNGNAETEIDPISAFFSEDSNYPSNADAVNQALYPDANDSDNRTVDRFFADDLISNPIGSGRAAQGHFIIDALDRGASRAEAYQGMIDKYSAVAMLDISTLPVDSTPSGATVVSEFAGRVFYGGFSGEVTDGDSQSPRMSSYVLFSKRINNTNDIVRCYQEGDLTAVDDPELLDTDGGFIRLDEAYGIKQMVNTASSLFVFAENGVWRIVGNEDSGFTATSFRVVKITDRGAIGPNSVVETEDAMVYWSDDGIYNVKQNQFGDWQAANLTTNKIEKFYSKISPTDKINSKGFYDSYDKKIRWVYSTALEGVENTKELILDAQLGAFYTSTIFTPEGTTFPKVVDLFETNPFVLSTTIEDVYVGTDQVLAGTEEVEIGTTTRADDIRSIYYLVVSSLTPFITYSFAFYKDTTFADWVSVDGTGVDAAAYNVTGYLSGGDFQRNKQLQHLTMHMRKTETGFS